MAEATKDLPKEPVILSLDPTCLDDVLKDIMRVGEATASGQHANALTTSLTRRIDRVREKVGLANTRPRVACLEWMEPVLCAGHWVPEIVDLAGGEDCLGRKDSPSFGVKWQQVLAQNPEVIVVMPCGFDAKRTLNEVQLLTSREGWDSLPAVRQGRVYAVDASSYFSRSGPRLLDGLEIMAEILHPELFSGMVPKGGAIRIYGESFSH